MKLLIVESPSKAKTINQYLGKDFVVTSSYGHIRSLPSETGSVMPDQDFAMIYKEHDHSAGHIKEITQKAKKCDEIYLATDPDREGEAISWHIMEVLNQKHALPVNVKVQRVVFHEITKKAILEAMKSPRAINMSLVHAQQARQALDYLVGFTLSPVLWRKLPGSKSAGRVQSVALRMICEREAEIEKFKSQEYWSIEAEFQDKMKTSFSAWLNIYQTKKLEKFDINNQVYADKIVKHLEGEKYSVKKVEKKQVSRSPLPPFTTSTMLQDAARKFGFTTKKTSRIAQDLYEGIEVDGKDVGLITYMRTDSVNISADALTEIREHITTSYGDKYLPSQPRFYKTKTKNAQEAHEAIRPTNISLHPQKVKSFLRDEHFKLYELIWRRTVASQIENAIMEVCTVDINDSSGENIFRATGSVIVFDGYNKVYVEGSDDDEDKPERKILPKLTEGDIVTLDELLPKQHFTQPPHRYTEAGLVKGMEELGIGRPSTYPTVISILQEREYVRVDKRRFIPETKGRLVNSFLICYFPKYVEYDFTAKLEDELDDISNGTTEWKDVLKDFWEPFKDKTDEVLGYKNVDIVQQIQRDLADYIFHDLPVDEENNHKCPSCKEGNLELKTGKFGAFIGCSSYPNCKFTKQLGSLVDKKDNAQSSDSSVSDFPKVLGASPEGLEITLRKGPYGIYLQSTLGEKIKRLGLARSMDYSKVDLEYALKMLSLPRVVGDHPEGGVVKAGIGRFGPYVEYNGKFKSLKEDDPIDIEIQRAIELLNQAKESTGRPARKFTKSTKKTTKVAKKTKKK